MGKSVEREGFFGKYTEHYDDNGNKTGESREREGFFGAYTEHTDTSGSKTGESREKEGFFGDYTEHTDTSGSKTGESREREGFFGKYTEHTGSGWCGSKKEDQTERTTNNEYDYSSDCSSISNDNYGGSNYSNENSSRCSDLTPLNISGGPAKENRMFKGHKTDHRPLHLKKDHR